MSKYRDIRLQKVSPASLKRELVILSRVLTVAERDWGIAIPKNPIPLVSLPKVDKERTRRLKKGDEECLSVLRGQIRACESLSGGVISFYEEPLFTYSARGVSGAFLKRCRRSGINDLHSMIFVTKRHQGYLRKD